MKDMNKKLLGAVWDLGGLILAVYLFICLMGIKI